MLVCNVFTLHFSIITSSKRVMMLNPEQPFFIWHDMCQDMYVGLTLWPSLTQSKIQDPNWAICYFCGNWKSICIIEKKLAIDSSN